MKILITGNMGYVGSELVKYFREKYKSATIIGFDIGYFAHCLTGTGVLPEANVDIQYFGDVRLFPEELLRGVDVLIHLAAVSNDPIGNEFEKVTEEVNFGSTKLLANISLKMGVKHFVYASSCSIYGEAIGGARTERDSVNPLTAYAKSKVNSELFLKDFSNDNMTITALRFSTACGLSDRLRLDLVLNDFVASAVLNGEINILSDGSPWRPMINVKDMCRAIDWASFRDCSFENKFLAINIGSKEWNYQVKELANEVAKAIPNTTVVINANAQPDKRSYQVDFSLFEELAPSFQPVFTLSKTIEELSKPFFDRQIIVQNDFRNSPLIRFNILKFNIANNILNRDLAWTNR